MLKLQMVKLSKPSIRLLATDIDGTLLNPQFQISERDLAALRRAHAAGIEVVLLPASSYLCASYRAATWIRFVADQLKWGGHALAQRRDVSSRHDASRDFASACAA